MARKHDRPVVGVTGCCKFIEPHPYYAVGEKYVRAVAEGCDALPFLIPPLADWYDLDALLERLDGILVTGSPSNVEPHLYGGPPARPGTLSDPVRDATNLPLIRAAIESGVPMLAICRGIQELNVAFGGSLHQHVEEVAGRNDHNPGRSAAVDVQYGPAHDVHLAPGGQLARLFGVDRITVNSIHSQGIDRLGKDLTVEATAPDGQIEAVSVAGANVFSLAVQWHPEWRFEDDPHSSALFGAFAAACRGCQAGTVEV